MLMTSFNTIDSIPSSGNEWLMRDVLRDEWKYEGIVISDWGAVKELIPHGVATDEKEAAQKASRYFKTQRNMREVYVTTTYSPAKSNITRSGRGQRRRRGVKEC